ncbi:hypothetical protein ACFVGY_18620 [Streptomyces sp. NPDC127106]|uniref:hypothetical protein n=1 Tax=Streptomyces sp. NPDC127106 TaxID=3345360 RepID=UPI00362ABA80
MGNTPAVCRASSIHPCVVEPYVDGQTVAPALGALGRDAVLGQPATQGVVEGAVLDLLRSGHA